MKVLVFIALAAALAAPATAQSTSPPPPSPPSFSFDIDWMHVPAPWVLGTISAVTIDRNDNVWILHRPRTLPEAKRAQAAPPVLEFGPDGRFLRAWGGPGSGYNWPINEHSLLVDDRDRVWLTGNGVAPGNSDQMILQFTTAGKFVRQIGAPNVNKGDRDTSSVSGPANLFADLPRRDLYVADGYVNRRVIVFDSETGKFKRMWGAFGAPPPNTPAPPAPPMKRAEGAAPETGDGPSEFRTVHDVRLSRDGKLYVADRDNGRVQVFDRNGKFERQIFIHRTASSRQSAASVGFSTDKAQRWLYVLDLGNSQLAVFDRKTLTPVSDIGGPGKASGQFATPHLMAINSKGEIYISELASGRVQKLTPLP